MCDGGSTMEEYDTHLSVFRDQDMSEIMKHRLSDVQ